VASLKTIIEDIFGPPDDLPAINGLGAAVKSLSRYYTALSRPDLVQIALAEGPNLDKTGRDTSGVSMELEKLTAKMTPGQFENIMDVLLDNTAGAYFVHDMLTQDKLKSQFALKGSYDGTQNFVQIVFEPDYAKGGLETFILKECPEVTFPIPASVTEKEASIKGITTSVAIPLGGSGEVPDPYTVNLAPASPTRNASTLSGAPEAGPNLVAFILPNHKISPKKRMAAATTLFMNAIPTVEMSRCTPYLDVRLVTNLSPVPGAREQAMTISRFLGMSIGEGTPGGGQDNTGMVNALPVKAIDGSQPWMLVTDPNASDPSKVQTFEPSVSAAGMELFASPQTMVNANINSRDSDGNLAYGTGGSVIDPMVPFMTLESFEINVVGTGQAILADKRGRMKFTLHDRSRMPDIQPIIDCGLFAGTYIVVEYGWAHPDGYSNSNNAFGVLLNNMRCKSTFNIEATNFTIDGDGQVHFTMDLATRGRTEANTVPIYTGNLMPIGPFKQIIGSWLASQLQQLASDNPAVPPKTQKEIRGKLDFAMNKASDSSSAVPRALFDQFMAVINPPPADPATTDPVTVDVATVIEGIKTMVGDPADENDTGSDAVAGANPVSEIQSRIDMMKTTPDPFAPGTLPQSVTESINTGGVGSLVSLGKIIMNFIGVPLTACGRFDEVQVFFCRFNDNAGAAKYYDSIANFLIDIEDFANKMTDPESGWIAGNPGMSISAFVNFLTREVIQKSDSVNYGVTALQNSISDAQKAQAEAKGADAKQMQAAIKSLSSDLEERLVSIYASGMPAEPTFVPPQIKIILEAVPVIQFDPSLATPDFVRNDSKTILRVIVCDENASPSQDEQFLLAAATDGLPSYRQKTTGTAESIETASADGKAPKPPGGQSGLVEYLVGTSKVSLTSAENINYANYASSLDNNAIKRLIKSYMPSITYGTSFSAIKTFRMASTTGGSVATTKLMDAVSSKQEKPGESPAKSSGFEDVTVIPSNATMTILGCPLLEYGQEFFIDLGTGTTADNVYTVLDIRHILRPGTFETQCTMRFTQSATMSTLRSQLLASLPTLEKAGG
tara:strand:- start:16551 stop:19754 length:3204 start_codon:yes stop_codon:yes gene_type:complete